MSWFTHRHNLSSDLLRTLSDSNPLLQSHPISAGRLDYAPFRSRHNILNSELFSDDRLASLIDNHPVEAWTISSMGTNPKSSQEWGTADATGLSGSELLQAIKKGRLWMNIRSISDYHPQMAKMVAQLYYELKQIDPTFKPLQYSGNLIISSPRAMVYMHVDATQNLLWHIRGNKRIWVYPTKDERFIRHSDLEAIVANQRGEDLEYAPEMDQFAQCYDLVPGDWLSWPHHSPHRIENLSGMNVSLSTEHITAEGRRTLRVLRANYMVRRQLSVQQPDPDTRGINYRVKSALDASMRFSQKLGILRPDAFSYPTRYRVDPDAPEGVVQLSR